MKFELVKPEARKCVNEPKLPTRATKHSAGYDIYLADSIVLAPHSKALIPTDIKAQMDEDVVLLVFIRSSVGIKKGVIIANGTGVIDSDYYSNPDNDGNIHLALWNTTDAPVIFEKGERVAQGIFVKYGIANDDTTAAERVGGIGSTKEK